MCGRFTQAAPGEVIAELFDLPEVPKLAPRYNIAPTQDVAGVRMASAGGRALVQLHWGLIPSWAKERSIGSRMINARAETVAEKPAFRAALRNRRCLVIADGFYEWQRLGARKQPYFIELRDGRPFAFAGLWERWAPEYSEPVESCTILTTTANEAIAAIHDRMPVILDAGDHAAWLDPDVKEASRLLPLLRPRPAEAVRAYPVGLLVNTPANDVPACRAPLVPR
ncbi:MAG: SOS response-associated peptidase [Thermoanaerobaculaceae bacterium]|jgi:putative SOS response-associated peptidase YedK